MVIVKICRENNKARSLWSSIDIIDLSEICEVFDGSDFARNYEVTCNRELLLIWINSHLSLLFAKLKQLQEIS